ncbi:hypothetical protein TrCOL_g4327 [Triparma columacea]|uniref:PhoD-like phosphatase metallophosphatase domain-containing protein n=1 Tax=Triparma columacea TaxID=722753 RepID=A0A9W7GQL0_9STRA|nr:hypothetical protein TrCOL_g4327 [Triparma columacea]
MLNVGPLIFLSCNNPLMPLTPPISSLWSLMHSLKPSGLIWAGDAVYGDSLSFSNFPFSRPQRIPATPTKMRSYYDLLLSSPHYPIPGSYATGTLDDHDSGRNNAGNQWEGRFWAGEMFKSFLRESNAKAGTDLGGEGGGPEPPVGGEGRKGVYSVTVFDMSNGEHYSEDTSKPTPTFPSLPDTASNRTIAVFSLDCRTFKTEWYDGFDFTGSKGLEGDFLGPQQWSWISEMLPQSTATFNVIVNGLQVLPLHRVPNGNLAEDWSKFPLARSRLLSLLLNSGKPFLLVSGDVHMAQLMSVTCTSSTSSPTTPPITVSEVTTSGVTHSWGNFFSPSPKSRQSRYYPYMRAVSSTFMHLAHTAMPWKDIERGPEGGGRMYSLDYNFMVMDFDEGGGNVYVDIMGPGGKVMGRNYEVGGEREVGEGEWTCEPIHGKAGMGELAVGYFVCISFMIVSGFGPLVLGAYIAWSILQRTLRAAKGLLEKKVKTS